jgi:hypothetical protein
MSVRPALKVEGVVGACACSTMAARGSYLIPPKELSELYHGINTNNYPLVHRYLDSGADPSVNLASFVTKIGIFKPITLCSDGTLLEGILSPLHLAVCNCYRSGNDGQSPSSTSMIILKKIIGAGADTSLTVANFLFFGYIVVRKAVTPYGLALSFKRTGRPTNEGAKLMDAVIQELLKAASEKDRYAYSTPRSVTVPESVANTWKALLFSEKFSDVKFKCQDGTTFYAHKCVLAAASPYFSTAFEGPWGEQHEDGLWETSNPAPVMKALLSFIYTGEVMLCVMEQQPDVMFAVVSEYSMPELRELCEASCTRSLGFNNVKSMLQLAHLHGSSALKQSCFDFVQKNMAKVLTDPAVVILASEDAELWAELAAAISPDSGKDNTSEGSSKKRGRSSERA